MPETPPPPPPDRPVPDPAAGPDGASGRAQPPPASFGQVVGAVFWSFFGVRKGNAMRSDEVRIRPQQVILVGVLLAAVFVATLLVIVRTIIKTAGA
ncbi:MAG: DUF2970 domain-containing protein [Burkholderiales bacterium]|nr:DUF2970 domain-containing protein [Burkholderiales bacterium]